METTRPTEPRERYDRLVRAAQTLPPVTTAVAHPCDQISIEGVVEAARLGLIAPILVGPPTRIRDAAQKAESDISAFPIEASAHSHDSAAKAVELVRQGEAEALMKGSLHTDELMGAVVARETGIRTARRISHCFVMDVPGHKDPLIISDAAVNIARPRRQSRYRAERDRSRPCIGISRGAGRDHVGDGDRQSRRPIDYRSGGAVQNGRTRSDHGRDFSTARWRSTMRSMKRRQRSSTSFRWWPAAPTCWSCRISKPATCSPKAFLSSAVRLPPASCSARACRSS